MIERTHIHLPCTVLVPDVLEQIISNSPDRELTIRDLVLYLAKQMEDDDLYIDLVKELQSR